MLTAEGQLRVCCLQYLCPVSGTDGVVAGSKRQVPGRSKNCFMAHFALLGNTWLLPLLCIAKQSEQGDIGVQAGQ